ncbi:MAG: hypothetical protein OCD76_19115 [Reichenbachiella sp.]
MTPEQFVKNFHSEKMNLIEMYFQNGETGVSEQIAKLNLNDSQLSTLKSIISNILTDCLYTTLLGLDGAASIGDHQELYKITDEKGNELTGGDIESNAWEYFHNEKK